MRKSGKSYIRALSHSVPCVPLSQPSHPARGVKVGLRDNKVQ